MACPSFLRRALVNKGLETSIGFYQYEAYLIQNMFNKIIKSLRNRTGLLVIITAALLLELLSGSQYYLTRGIMEEELENRTQAWKT